MQSCFNPRPSLLMDEGSLSEPLPQPLTSFNPRPSLLMDEGQQHTAPQLRPTGFNPRPSLLMDEGNALLGVAKLCVVSIHVHHC